MPNKPKTPLRSFRCDDKWDELLQRANEAGSDRSAVLNDLMAWWLRRPGAKMPPRPAKGA